MLLGLVAVGGSWLISGCAASERAASGEQSGSAGVTGSVGAGSGGVQAAGSSGVGAGGGAGTGVLAGSGGGAGVDRSCKTLDDCQHLGYSMPRCYPPGQRFQSSGCGTPNWCGECACEQQPVGFETSCEGNEGCPVRPAQGAGVYLSLCTMDTHGCSECVTDQDCPAENPACLLVADPRAPFYACGPCAVDTDCPSERAHCVNVSPGSSLTGKLCRECASTLDCPTGTCTNGTCVACHADSDCGDVDLMACDPSTLRCGRRACSGDCGGQTDCENGFCTRRSCNTDADCKASGLCVELGCFDVPGTCFNTAEPP